MKYKETLFEKVSEQQFVKDMEKNFQLNTDDPLVLQRLIFAYEMFVAKPTRATTGSCGYDFVSPVSFAIHPGQMIVVPTGIRVMMPSWMFLMVAPRSSLGIKHRVGLANTVGIIDSDYYDADNEGHIMIALENRGNEDVMIEGGDRFAQGIFIPRCLTSDDETIGTRTGGIGSTGN